MIRVPKVYLGALAVILLLAVAMPLLAAETKGAITSVAADKNQFVMRDTDGKNWTFHLNATGKVFINDKEGKLADLQAKDEVTVTYEKAGDNLNASEVRCTRKE
jgi:hypothetical protein